MTETTATEPPTLNITDSFIEAELAEEEHEFDAISALFLNVVIIGCLLLAYFVKKFRIYYLPESAGALLVGIVVGGVLRLTTEKLQLFEFVSISLLLWFGLQGGRQLTISSGFCVVARSIFLLPLASHNF